MSTYAERQAAIEEQRRRTDVVYRRSMTGLVTSIVVGLPMLFLGAVNGWIGFSGAMIMLVGIMASLVYCFVIGDRWVDEVEI